MNVFVAGENGMVGSSIVRELRKNSKINIISANREKLDLLDQYKVSKFFKDNKIDVIFLAAAKVGGILANNKYPAQFIYENITILSNIINSAHWSDVNKIIYLGSSCIYPKYCKQPIREEYLLTGKLELTNEPYAIAKIAGIKLCESYNRQYGRDYRCVMPTNLYGPNDNFHSENSHVIPAMLKRFHNAILNKNDQVVIWGTGTPKREFLHVDDLASACLYISDLNLNKLNTYTKPYLSHINIGCGIDCSIKELAYLISKITGYNGEISFDKSKPDGTPKKILDISLIKSLGWEHSINLEDGLIETYKWYIDNFNTVRNNKL